MPTPKWLELAKAEVGTREVPGDGNNPDILQFYRDAGRPDAKHDAIPWCAAFAGAMLHRSGMEIPAPINALLARSYLDVGTPLQTPEIGCLAIYQRGQPWQGHVGFYMGMGDTDPGNDLILGGNQRDAVSYAEYPRSKLLGYVWPQKAGIRDASRPGATMDVTPRKRFFDLVREKPFGGKLTQEQVDGMNAILDGFEGNQRVRLTTAWMSYILATAFHETGFRMMPVREVGRGAGHSYGRVIASTGHAYYGRGMVQITHLTNYQYAGEQLGIDLVSNPDRALELDISVQILIRGMAEGWFTGRSLGDYIPEHDGTVLPLGMKPGATAAEYIEARRVVNGEDRANEIAKYAQAFEKAIIAWQDTPAPKPQEPQEPDVIPDVQDGMSDLSIPELVDLLKKRYGARAIRIVADY